MDTPQIEGLLQEAAREGIAADHPDVVQLRTQLDAGERWNAQATALLAEPRTHNLDEWRYVRARSTCHVRMTGRGEADGRRNAGRTRCRDGLCERLSRALALAGQALAIRRPLLAQLTKGISATDAWISQAQRSVSHAHAPGPGLGREGHQNRPPRPGRAHLRVFRVVFVTRGWGVGVGGGNGCDRRVLGEMDAAAAEYHAAATALNLLTPGTVRPRQFRAPTSPEPSTTAMAEPAPEPTLSDMAVDEATGADAQAAVSEAPAPPSAATSVPVLDDPAGDVAVTVDGDAEADVDAAASAGLVAATTTAAAPTAAASTAAASTAAAADADADIEGDPATAATDGVVLVLANVAGAADVALPTEAALPTEVATQNTLALALPSPVMLVSPKPADDARMDYMVIKAVLDEGAQLPILCSDELGRLRAAFEDPHSWLVRGTAAARPQRLWARRDTADHSFHPVPRGVGRRGHVAHVCMRAGRLLVQRKGAGPLVEGLTAMVRHTERVVAYTGSGATDTAGTTLYCICRLGDVRDTVARA